MNAEDFVTYEQAISLKKLGFKEDCFYHYTESGNITYNIYICNEIFTWILSCNLLKSYNSDINTNECDAPTLAQVQGWLRKEKNKYVSPVFLLQHHWNCNIYDVIEAEPEFCSDVCYNSYEEALSAGITECIKLLEKEENED